ncbi:MAG: rRNA pseudouridine synthase [Planctomycetes bacterium]|nr:rRNA pseudouridine synthase [Planctomycetota bacterium]
MKLQKFLAECGIVSRHHAEEFIRKGLVEVNNRIVTSPEITVDPSKDEVKYKGLRCRIEKKFYIILNKPRGYVSTFKDNLGRKSVYQLIPPESSRVFPVGRLDMDAEGLMLFTNDGDLANTIMHPRYAVPKTYYIVCSGRVDDGAINALKNGIWISEGKIVPKEVNLLKRMREKTILRMTITEGKKNELKRIIKKVGNRVIHLKRLSIGPLRLGDLKTGSYRYLTEKEIQLLRGYVDFSTVPSSSG